MGWSIVSEVVFAFLSLGVCNVFCARLGSGKYPGPYEPNQIHLSYTGSLDSMFVTWATFEDGGEGHVTYSTFGQEPEKAGARKMELKHESEDTPEFYRLTYIYRATMTKLSPDTVYEYQVFNLGGKTKSAKFTFKTFPEGDDITPTLAVYGDLGVVSHVSLPKLRQDAAARKFDMVLHVGDMAYNMNEDLGFKGDIFMNLLQAIATKVPYQVAVGNHEQFNNFTEYSGRFTSPGPSVFYNSFNLGPVHFVTFTTEFYFYDNYGIGQLQAQYNWLVEDLREANLPENRARQPWIITMGHRPMYCSSRDDHDCTLHDSIMRTGYENKYYALEKLFFENGVDIQFYGHEHNYQRLYPIYNYKYEITPSKYLYSNPKYPVHIISGSAGCYEIHAPLSLVDPEWCAVRTTDYGFMEFKILNNRSLEFFQYSVPKGKYIDHFVVTKDTDYPRFGRSL